jgi:hypothetical protein
MPIKVTIFLMIILAKQFIMILEAIEFVMVVVEVLIEIFTVKQLGIRTKMLEYKRVKLILKTTILIML